MPKITCIICAYNEGSRIGKVLDVVSNHPMIDEIIVVDDGSEDDTKDKVKSYPKVRLISHGKNMGKSQATCTGVANATHECLVFLDADLLVIDKEDVSNLIKPVTDGECDVTIALYKNSLTIYKMLGLDFVAGMRTIYKKNLLSHLENISTLPGYGIEIYINKNVILKNKLKIKVVDWKNVTFARKKDKVGSWAGFLGEIKMVLEIMKIISLWEIISQNFGLLRLRV